MAMPRGVVIIIWSYSLKLANDLGNLLRHLICRVSAADVLAVRLTLLLAIFFQSVE